MLSIVLASKNPVKVQATLRGFHRMFPGEPCTIHTVTAPSGVRSQPFSSAETLQGACNRVQQATHLVPEADYWVGIEGGVEDQQGEMAAFAWVVVRSRTLVGKSRTGTFFLPAAVTNLLRQGIELGEADDAVFGRTNSKQASGAIGLLTGDVLDRTQLYEQAVILALVPFKNVDLYAVTGEHRRAC